MGAQRKLSVGCLEPFQHPGGEPEASSSPRLRQSPSPGPVLHLGPLFPRPAGDTTTPRLPARPRGRCAPGRGSRRGCRPLSPLPALQQQQQQQGSRGPAPPRRAPPGCTAAPAAGCPPRRGRSCCWGRAERVGSKARRGATSSAGTPPLPQSQAGPEGGEVVASPSPGPKTTDRRGRWGGGEEEARQAPLHQLLLPEVTCRAL